MKHQVNTQKVLKMKSTKSFRVYFKSARKFDTFRSADSTVYTFDCVAVDHDDAIRQLRMSRMFTVKGMKVKKDGTKVPTLKKFVRRFHVVRVFNPNDPYGHCDCSYCHDNPEFSSKVVVLKPRRSLMRNYFGKGR